MTRESNAAQGSCRFHDAGMVAGRKTFHKGFLVVLLLASAAFANDGSAGDAECTLESGKGLTDAAEISESVPPAAQLNTIIIEESVLPKIENLSHRDAAFRSIEDARAANDMAAARGKLQTLEFYRYVAKKDDDLFNIASAVGIPYDAIVTLNAIASSVIPLAGKTIIIPSAKGIFIPENPQSSLEILTARENAGDALLDASPVYRIGEKKLRFLPGKRFSSTQRAFFLDSSIKMPIKSKIVSSAFGYRVSPVYGHWKFHKGIDLVAPTGDPVFACKGGVVTLCVRNNAIFGNYIVIDHGGGMTSTYAHLSKISVKKGETVSGGSVIGAVGTTGASTGPHLHFEIRLNGAAQDPAKLLPLN